ncbi:MAG: hypothetical protein R3D78_00960 [Paracoccaceae bacterium]
MARDLAGVAHVVCEPSREFSFRLRDRVDGENVYNGTLGVAVPGGGFVHRAYLGKAIPDEKALVERVKSVAVTICSQMPKVGAGTGLDFQDGAASAKSTETGCRQEENEKLWNDELALKEARIQELEAELCDARNARFRRRFLPSGMARFCLFSSLKSILANFPTAFVPLGVLP